MPTEIRTILKKHLNDNHFEIRGEALIGLAKRGDKTILNALKQELSKKFEVSYQANDEITAIRACKILVDKSLPAIFRMLEKAIFRRSY